MNSEKTFQPRPAAMIIYTGRDQGEIMELTHAAGYDIRQTAKQNLDAPSRSFFLGSGKVKEIQQTLQENPEVQTIVFDTDLSPLQVRNLEETFGISVADRTDIILQIFLQRAASAQSKLQVENAILKRSKNRLTRQNINFSRQGGGMKNKGTGETQLELDRRNIQAQIAANEKELEKLARQRGVQRKARQKADLPLVSLAGYTNAGKSTILNGLLRISGSNSQKTVLEKDQLFATLDPAVRRIDRPLKRSFLLTDTVGFISDLPHDLIQGFQTTLEEITLSDLILVVEDVSNPSHEMQREVVLKTLEDIHAGEIPRLTVRNKADDAGLEYPVKAEHSVQICAREEDSLETLLSSIEDALFGPAVMAEISVPYVEAKVLANLFSETEILEQKEDEENFTAVIRISSHRLPDYRPWLKDNFKNS